jgi:hypothetical protein
VGTSRRTRYGALGLGLSAFFGLRHGALADPPAAPPPNPPAGEVSNYLPQDGFFSSLKQAAKQGYDHEVVRGHFDLGAPPNVHRYYCLQDTRTGEKEPNGVLGETVPLADGKTGVKNSSVSMYTCASAERHGMLVTAGYGIDAAAATITTTTAEVSREAQPPAAPSSAPAASALPPGAVKVSPNQIDIGGVKLGMSPDEVRAVLKAKKLLDYTESAETLSYLDSAKGAMQALPNGRFVNVIAAWTPPSAAAADSYQVDGESYEVLFTPVPGQEQVMGVIHSVGYSPANAIHEIALENGLTQKYGGYPDADGLPASPTWRVQSDGTVRVGDPCNRRGTLGGLGALNVAAAARGNLALKGTAEDFRSQMDRCGAAIVTEDHFTANGGALRADRLVTRFTVTAYSPAIGFEGAKTAGQLIHAAGGSARKSDSKALPASSL